jgi:hypothetical protein
VNILLFTSSKKGRPWSCHYVSAIPGKMGSGSSMLFVKRMCYWNCFAPFDYRMYGTFGKIWVFVDAVITDGASWKRNMWKQFGVTEEKVWVTHPSDIKRQL